VRRSGSAAARAGAQALSMEAKQEFGGGDEGQKTPKKPAPSSGKRIYNVPGALTWCVGVWRAARAHACAGGRSRTGDALAALIGTPLRRTPATPTPTSLPP
jgi:hypothetical protein